MGLLSNLWNLIQNENMKIYRRPRTWIIFTLLIALILGGVIMEKVFYDQVEEDWEAQYRERIEYHQAELRGDFYKEFPRGEEGEPSVEEPILDYEPHPEYKEWLEREIDRLEYALEHQIPPNTGSMWSTVQLLSGLIALVTIFAVIISADIVASEFNNGTIKLLLIRPVSRAKILLSKYAASLIFALLLLVTLFVFSIILSGIFFGFKGINQATLLMLADGTITHKSIFVHILQTYGLKLIEVIMFVSLGFMMSTIFKSNSLATGLTIFLLFMGEVLVLLFSRYEWAKFILFANLDLSRYLNQGYYYLNPVYEGMTLSFSLMVLAVYFIIINAISWMIFTKKDITA